jgi:hypothetical protein
MIVGILSTDQHIFRKATSKYIIHIGLTSLCLRVVEYSI